MFEVFPWKSGCVDCLLSHTTQASPSFNQLVNSFNEITVSPSTPAIPPTMTLLTSWIMKRWIDLVIGKKPLTGNRMTRFDFHTFEVTEVLQWDRIKNCPSCGKDSNLSPKVYNLFNNLIPIH